MKNLEEIEKKYAELGKEIQALKENNIRSVLTKKFNSQLDKFSEHLNTGISEKLSNLFDSIADTIISFGFQDNKVSITSNPSLSFELNDKDNFKLIFDIFILENNDTKVVYSLYENNELIELNDGALNDAKNKCTFKYDDIRRGSKYQNFIIVIKLLPLTNVYLT